MYTIFQTPTSFDLRAVEVSGFTAKPNSRNPIGRFGTGLKYAICILLREGATIDLYCNGNHYEFYLVDVEFRGEKFRQVSYRKRSVFSKFLRSSLLPFTTEYGKDWELWQAFRELYANTIDENGTVFTDYLSELGVDLPDFKAKEDGQTYIVVKHLEFSRLVEKRHEIFLDQHRNLLIDKPEANVAPGESQHIYYRGMRAMDLPKDKKALFTYNLIDEQELTEDRTLKEPYAVQGAITDLVVKSHDRQFIKEVLTAPAQSLEADLDFEYKGYVASPEFKEVATEVRNHKSVNRSVRAFYGRYISPPKEPTVSDSVWAMVKEALELASHKLSGREITEMSQNSIEEIYLGAFEEVMER